MYKLYIVLLCKRKIGNRWIYAKQREQCNLNYNTWMCARFLFLNDDYEIINMGVCTIFFPQIIVLTKLSVYKHISKKWHWQTSQVVGPIVWFYCSDLWQGQCCGGPNSHCSHHEHDYKLTPTCVYLILPGAIPFKNVCMHVCVCRGEGGQTRINIWNNPAILIWKLKLSSYNFDNPLQIILIIFRSVDSSTPTPFYME